MKIALAALLLSSCFSCARAAPDSTASTSPMTERERVDYLLWQNQALTDENARLKVLSERARTKEEAFAMCMQAAKGDKSAMAAESVGGHCDQLLKR